MADRCKYQKLQYQVSYNNGSTWEDVTPIQVKKGDIIEYISRDCSEIQTLYRWVDLEGTYLCDGNNKYTRQIQEESYDNGVSWYASYPTVYQQGTFVGVDAEYCCDKFIGHYIINTIVEHNCQGGYVWNGYKCAPVDPLKVVKCNGSNILSSDETKYYSNNYHLVSAEIGDTVTSIGINAFHSYTGLTSCTIGSSVTSIGNWAFASCYSLTSVTIPNSVTTIGYNAFYNCSGLTSVNIPCGITSISNSAFTFCSSLISIDIPSGVTSIGEYTFYYCRSLTSATIGSGVTSIGDYAFTYCVSLTSVTVEATTPPTLGNNAFADTKGCPIYVPCGSVDTYRHAIGWSNYASRIYGIPPCDENMKFIATYSGGTSFSALCDSSAAITSATTKPIGYDYTKMLTAEIGDCVTSIGDYAFWNCSSLTSIVIPSGITTIGYETFRYCSSLYSITFLATTPPTIGSGVFTDTNGCPIYVPSASVNTYKTAWSVWASRIQAIP